MRFIFKNYYLIYWKFVTYLYKCILIVRVCVYIGLYVNRYSKVFVIYSSYPASAPTGEANSYQPAQQDVKLAPEAILPKTEANQESV